VPTDDLPERPLRDPRPQPRYGELAPEGWNWDPASGAPAGPASAVPGAADATTARSAAPGRPSARDTRGGTTALPVPSWDRPVTIGLLVLGLAATFVSVTALSALPSAIQVLYSQSQLGTYQPAASVAGLILAGGLTEALVWLLTAATSVLLLVRSRRAFYVPLIGAVVGFVVIFAFMSVVLATDPTLLNFYSRP
jgi:hypothetical protein